MKENVIIRITKIYSQLLGYKKLGKDEQFRELFMSMMPDVRAYISNRLANVVSRGQLRGDYYSVDDLIGDLYISAYEEIESIADGDDFHIWLYAKIDEIIEDKVVEEEFDDFFFKNIDNYSRKEWDAMEENVTVDADGDLVLEDELDSEETTKKAYDLPSILADDPEDELIERLNKELSEEQIDKHISMVLRQLPESWQSVFDLQHKSQLTTRDIALIKGMRLTEITEILNEINNITKRSLRARYLE